ncbi:aldo/keto reductase [Entomomonas sp. E2T0]|uniref:aldo/keto reductase n=1 Tax=Entomomonas sp. E2T0 TaxID=2930213 RepID=UPI0022283E5F|nr:aldo/keto reductase [Entomomonas sp. E2T0]UYZ83939.1 aldo/keto reductase [Entomomonas sp. E2T0]
MLQTRKLAGKEVMSIGLGCMNLSHAYNHPLPEKEAKALIDKALDLGVNHFDTATLYGFGANENLLGTSSLKAKRSQIFLASKCGMAGVNGKRVIDGRPATIKAQCNESLKRLATDHLDLYYLHRRDFTVPIEESVGALADLVKEGKIRAIGLSEVSANTLQQAHAIHPIAAVQNEYSLWSRNPELGLLETCKKLKVALVAFSPVARGFLASSINLHSLPKNDIRLAMPRFQEPQWSHNQQLFKQFAQIAQQANCSPAQLALYWLLRQSDWVIPIPGTTNINHLQENIATINLDIADDILTQVTQLINQQTVQGNRYPKATLAEIDTESFSEE